MKNSLIAVAFMLIGTFAFASNEVIEIQNTNAIVETIEMGEDFACVPATLSCGIEGIACGETTADLVLITLIADLILCD